MSGEKGPRWQVPGRDQYVSKQTPARGVPEFVDEECTGKYDGEDLAARRARRPTPERISKLEVDRDEMRKEIVETRLEVRGVGTKVDTLLDLATKAEAERERRSAADVAAQERQRRFIIAVIGALATAAAVVITALVAR